MAHTYTHNFDPSVHRTGYIPGTDFALPHLSRFSIAHDDEAALLRHVNCSLLSTPGVPPTLLALKQHAQSLTYLISMISPHGGDDEAVEVLVGRAKNATKAGTGRSSKRRKTGDTADTDITDGSLLHDLTSGTNDTTTDNPFDWLDLSRPYTNDADPGHHRPLVDLVNEVRARHDVLDTTHQCPLTTYTPRNGGRYARGPNANVDKGDERDWDEETFDKPRPYATHHNLLLHANLCLERLDHEYAGMGGLLSLLPTGTVGADDKEEKEDEGEGTEVTAARNTLVGQWLAFSQHLVGRMHELEIAYANTAHALRGHATAAGTGATADRWRMIHAGDDVWVDVHNKLDKAAAADTAWTAQRHSQGVAGERSSGASADHVVYVDINTRFYRTDAGGSFSRGVIYVCPVGAPGDVSGMVDVNGGGSSAAATAADQSAANLAAKVPFLSASALEQRYDHRLKEAGRLARNNNRLTQQLLQRMQALLVLRRDHKRVQALQSELQRSADEANRSLKKAEAELAGLKGTDRRANKGATPAAAYASPPHGANRQSRSRGGRGPADSSYRYARKEDSPSGEE